MSNFAEGIGTLLVATVTIFCFIGFFAALLTLPTYWLWNWLMPTLFGLKAITIWQAAGLNLLSGFLFKSSSTSGKK